ncbi:APC family permease [Endozoicomonas arenosclerae]|uniref:APC family permease n=1 Tax=Endozoicomonas arenosclerae TaxID=1633495 RepID=UPI0007819D72|nr:amino acid permease [Endozoicomonas arenosclerae]
MSSPQGFGLFSAVMLVIANVIGAGTFTLTGLMLAEAGHPLLVISVWMIGGIVMLSGAVCYGAMARAIPESGGEYLFLSRTLHPFFGCLAGWVSLMVGFTAPIALCAYGLGLTFSAWTGISTEWIGTLMILLFMGAHCFHMPTGLKLQNFVIVIKIVLILAFVAVASFEIHFDNLKVDPGVVSQFNMDALPLCLIWTFFGYSGWNAIIYVAGEIRAPQKNVMKATLIGSLCVFLIYMALNLVIVSSQDLSLLSGKIDVVVRAAEQLSNPLGLKIALLVINLSLITSLSAMIMMGPRIYSKMADDGYLPAFLSSKDGRFSNATLFQAALAIAFLWLGSCEWLMTCVGYMLGLSSALCITSLVRLKLSNQSLLIPFWPVTPAFFLLAVVLATTYVVFNNPWHSLMGLLVILPAAYCWWMGRNITDGNVE